MTAADDALAVLFGLRNEDGRPWGVAADELQVADARAVLSADGPRRHWLGRPRGYSKTQDVAGMMLADLVTGRIPLASPAYLAAADGDQAGLALDSIAGYVERSALTALVDVQGRRAIHKGTGASVEVLAADAAGAFGLRPSRLVLDELAQWGDTRQARKFYEALTTALPKVAGSVGVVITTAGTPGHWSRAVYQRALKERKLWRVSMTHTPAPWIDRQLIEAERRALTDSAFRRLWENRWTEAEDALVTAEDLDAAAVLDGQLAPVAGVRYVVTLDVGLVNDRTVAVVAHREEPTGQPATEGLTGLELPWLGGRVVVDCLLRWQGSRRKPVDLDEITETIADLHRRYPGTISIDPAKAEHLLQRLRKRELPITEFNFTTGSVGLLAGSLLRALRSRRISLPKDPVLLDELANVRIVENSAGVPRLDHDSGKHDDQAVALALAVHALTDAVRRPIGPRIFSDDEMAELRARQVREQFGLPEPMPAFGPWAGDTTMAAAGIVTDGDPDEPRPNGKTKRSPFA